MTDERHIVITLADAKLLAELLVTPVSISTALPRIRLASRFMRETGADIREIVELLQRQSTCVACNHEGMAHTCESIGARKLGRRLRRLLERAQ